MLARGPALARRELARRLAQRCWVVVVLGTAKPHGGGRCCPQMPNVDCRRAARSITMLDVYPDKLRVLAGAQDGLVTRRQALACGMTAEGIRHAVGSGRRWQRVIRGVYATFTGPLNGRHEVRAALLYAGSSALVTGSFACRAYGLRYVPSDAPLLVLVPATVYRQPTSHLRLLRVRTMPACRWIGGIPVALVERAVLDTCRGMTSMRPIRVLLCEAVQTAMTTPAQLAVALGQARWKSAGMVRRTLADAIAGCRSAPECELRDLVRSSLVLSEPLWNQPLRGVSDVSIIPDVCWPAARVVVEIDSAQWHRLGDRVEHTERRRAQLASLGWAVLPVSPRRLRSEPAAVLAEIEAAVNVGSRRGRMGFPHELT
jgi:hypothetical protein